MKKAILTSIAAVAMLAMVSCKNEKPAEAADQQACGATEQCEQKCCKAEGDTARCCKAEGDTAKCCKAEGDAAKCCKAEGKECPKEAGK